MARTRRRYFWALHFQDSDPEVQALSEKARQGLAWAERLGYDARVRSHSVFEDEIPRAPLTVDDLTDWDTSRIQIHTAIKQARVELFGKELSDLAISYQLAKRRARKKQPLGCAEPGCPNTIPSLAHKARRYCPEHGAGAARVRRHRRQAAEMHVGRSG